MPKKGNSGKEANTMAIHAHMDWICMHVYIYIYTFVCTDPLLPMPEKDNDKEANRMAIHAHMDWRWEDVCVYIYVQTLG